MAVFDKISKNENIMDDSLSLYCTFDNYRLVDGHTEYIIKVHRGYDKNKCWTIFKRYKEFVALDKELQASSFNIQLPPKKYIGNLNRQFVLQRQNQLQNYMNKVLDNLVLASSVYIKKFLDPENYNNAFQDTAFQYASMALRGKPDFHNLKILQNIGWRFNKHYCMVKKLNDYEREYVLTWISEYGAYKCLTDKELQSAFKVLLELKHQYIMPIVTGNCYSSGTLMIRVSCTKGSLRDLIYNKSSFESFIQKYRYRNERLLLPSNAVCTIAVQVLQALAFLHQKGIPYGNLHSGNIFIEDNVAKISDIENGIFGLTSFYKPYFIENRKIRTLEDVDVYCFGHVLYEMAFGERLQCYYCDIVPSDCYDNFRPILELILSSSPKKKLPTIYTILSSDTFSMCSSNIIFDTSPHCKVSSHSKELFKRSQIYIEEKIHNEQNELRKFRKIAQLQELLEMEEKQDGVIIPKEKRKMKKASSQTSLGTSYSEPFENISNASTPTSVSTDSSSRISGCDKSNKNLLESNIVDDTFTSSNIASSASLNDNNRNAFLQSVINFDKRNLRKIKA